MHKLNFRPFNIKFRTGPELRTRRNSQVARQIADSRHHFNDLGIGWQGLLSAVVNLTWIGRKSDIHSGLFRETNAVYLLIENHVIARIYRYFISTFRGTYRYYLGWLIIENRIFRRGKIQRVTRSGVSIRIRIANTSSQPQPVIG